MFMFTIYDRQMIYSYFKAYAFCLISLMGLFIVVDLFLNLDDLMSHRQDTGDFLQFIGTLYGYKSFQIFDRLCEAIVLLAGMFTVAWMQRNNELVPLLSAGISTRRAVQPVLLCAFVMMGLVAINQEFALPRIDTFMVENKGNWDGSKKADVKGDFDMRGIHISGRWAVKKESLVIEFTAIIPRQVCGTPVTLYADEAVYIPEREGDRRSGGWLLKNATVHGSVDWATQDDDILKSVGDGNYFLRTTDVTIETVTRVKNWQNYLSTWSLLEEMSRPNSSQHARLAVAFHMRMTRPVVGIILVLLGLSVILRDQNRNIFISAGMCLGLTVIFFATVFGCQYLGTSEETRSLIGPALAAWLPVIIFGPLSLVMYDAVHT